MKKVFIYAVPCEKRYLDARRISTYFEKNNYKIVYKAKDADIILLLTCGVINHSADYSLKKIKEFKKYDGNLIVGGCLPDIENERITEIHKGPVITTKNIQKIDELFPENKIKFTEIEDANIFWDNVDESSLYGSLMKILNKLKFLKFLYLCPVRYYLKNQFDKNSSLSLEFLSKQFNVRVSWGCVGNCSYCAIKKAVGEYKSKPLKECVVEFKKGLKQGYKEFLLLADNIGAYGVDIDSSFPELLEKITNIPGDYRIYIHGFDPAWLVKYIDELEDIFKTGKIVNLDIPIQSGSSRILRSMNRYSDVKTVKDIFLRLKQKFPEITIGTQIIVGFPTETDEDFEKTLSFVTECGFDTAIFLPFSSRFGAKADSMSGKLSKKEIEVRMKLAKKTMKKYNYMTIFIREWKVMMFYKKL